MSTLLNFLKEQENAALAAGYLGALRHASPEGGTDTVGFGHKLTAEEERTGTVYGIPLRSLDMAAAEHILQLDVAKAQKGLDRELKKAHGVRLSDLSARKQMMLTDYQFNLGSAVRKFPSFTSAVISGDRPAQASEMVRNFTDAQGVKKPLARNRHFYNTFMSTEAINSLGE